MASVLVIGYGNELRGDDGVGPRVARTVAEWRLPEVRAIAVHQLTPELVDCLSTVDRVFFIDASVSAESVAMRKVSPENGSSPTALAHVSNPQSLLALCRALHGECPVAWTVTIPAAGLDFSEDLSPKAQLGLEQAISFLSKVCVSRH